MSQVQAQAHYGLTGFHSSKCSLEQREGGMEDLAACGHAHIVKLNNIQNSKLHKKS